MQGRYSPGSTFKIAVATAALEEGVVTPDFRVFCPGGGTFYGRFFQCHLKGGHGSVDMRHAIEKSCNTYFYTLGKMLEVDRIHKWASLLGLGERSGVDLPGELKGLVPSTEWKRQAMGERVVSRRNDLGVDRPGIGQRHADLARGHDDDGRQRWHALHAARRQGRRRGQGLAADPATAAAVGRSK